MSIKGLFVPKIARKLTFNEVKKLQGNGKYAVGGAPGLYLRIAGKSRAWVLSVVCGKRVNSAGKLVIRRLNLGLGSLSDVPLAQARKIAAEIRLGIKLGIDPKTVREEKRRKELVRARQQISFKSCANELIAHKKHEWSDKHAGQWISSLTNYAYPLIGQLPLNSITSSEVHQVLMQGTPEGQFWLCKTETANRVRGRIEAVMDYAIAKGYIEPVQNPARWEQNLKYTLPSPSKFRNITHYAAHHYRDIPALVKKLLCRCNSVEATYLVRLALVFILLTAVRTSEIRLAPAKEINIENGLWIIPAERMKKNREHVVPLSPEARWILKEMEINSITPEHYVWGGSKPYHEGFFLSTLKKYSRSTVHGFRSSFKDWCRVEATHYADEVSELALAHVNSDKTRVAYARDQLLDARRRLMNEWAAYCFSFCCTECGKRGK